jgi:hypothetical protein
MTEEDELSQLTDYLAAQDESKREPQSPKNDQVKKATAEVTPQANKTATETQGRNTRASLLREIISSGFAGYKAEVLENEKHEGTVKLTPLESHLPRNVPRFIQMKETTPNKGKGEPTIGPKVFDVFMIDKLPNVKPAHPSSVRMNDTLKVSFGKHKSEVKPYVEGQLERFLSILGRFNYAEQQESLISSISHNDN